VAGKSGRRKVRPDGKRKTIPQSLKPSIDWADLWHPSTSLRQTIEVVPFQHCDLVSRLSFACVARAGGEAPREAFGL